MADIVSTRLVVGMEIHVELATRSKMFTRAPGAAHPDQDDAEPNTLVDPVVAALPGVLPVMNRRAVEMSVMVGLALDCTIAPRSKWDRKNYFYPDLPKGYQISQYDEPLCLGGHLDIPAAGSGTTRIGIIRAHLEEDTGRLGHELPGGAPFDGSLVDLNRAGTPLLEIVTEPDLACAEDAVTFGKELRSICRCLGVTRAIMQRGHMRFEPNINVIITTDDGAEHATPIVEIKNLNSFRALHAAIEHEHERQVERWREDGQVMGPGQKRTHGWDDQRQCTVLQRHKEDAHDYRYFPEPDLVPVVVSDAWRETIAASLPELPASRRARWTEGWGIEAKDAAALVEDPALCTFYEACVEAAIGEDGGGMDEQKAGVAAAKMVLNTGARLAHERKCAVEVLGIAPRQVAQVIALRAGAEIGSSAAEALFDRLCSTDEDAATLAEADGLLQVGDAGQLDAWIEEALAAQPQAADDLKGGKQAAAGRIVGQVMKLSGGRADAKAVQQRLLEMFK